MAIPPRCWQISIGSNLPRGRRDLNEQRKKGIDALGHGDYKQALVWFRLAAEGGDSDAQHDLALMFRNGYGTPADEEEALRWYTRAAENGHAEARFQLAISLRDGFGGPPDPERAIGWMRTAAEAGHVDAMRELTLAYARGDGVERDIALATEWAARTAIAARDLDLLIALIEVIYEERAAGGEASDAHDPDASGGGNPSPESKT